MAKRARKKTKSSRAVRKPAPAKATLPTAHLGRAELEVRIAADPGRVWAAIVQDTARWWPADFNVGGPGARMTIEPRVGGRMFEEWGNDRGVLWGTILLFDPPNRLELVAQLTASFGGPATSIIQVALRADGGATVLALTDSFFGRVDEGSVRSISGGWKLIFGEALKQYIEAP